MTKNEADYLEQSYSIQILTSKDNPFITGKNIKYNDSYLL